MRILDVVILKGGCSAREINPLGDKPQPSAKGKTTREARARFNRDLKDWKDAEKKRRVFSIDFSHLIRLFKAMEKAVGGKIHHAHFGFDEGEKHKAEILPSGRIKIR